MEFAGDVTGSVGNAPAKFQPQDSPRLSPSTLLLPLAEFKKKLLAYFDNIIRQDLPYSLQWNEAYEINLDDQEELPLEQNKNYGRATGEEHGEVGDVEP